MQQTYTPQVLKYLQRAARIFLDEARQLGSPGTKIGGALLWFHTPTQSSHSAHPSERGASARLSAALRVAPF